MPTPYETTCGACQLLWTVDLEQLNNETRVVYRGAEADLNAAHRVIQGNDTDGNEEHRVRCPRCGAYRVITINRGG